jgi:hypothetical protein
MANRSIGGRGDTRESYARKKEPQALGPNTYPLGRYAVAKHGESQIAVRELIDAVLPSQQVQARHHKDLALYTSSKPRYQWSQHSTPNASLYGAALRNPLTWLHSISSDLPRRDFFCSGKCKRSGLSWVGNVPDPPSRRHLSCV